MKTKATYLHKEAVLNSLLCCGGGAGADGGGLATACTAPPA